jgi:hypothetical protein
VRTWLEPFAFDRGNAQSWCSWSSRSYRGPYSKGLLGGAVD